MCKHILNAQASLRAPCCRKWFDCATCHAENTDHPLEKTTEVSFLCKKCKKAFRKDMTTFEDADEFCPNCDNHFIIEAKTPAPMVGVEGEDERIDSRGLSNRDDRIKDRAAQEKEMRELWEKELAESLG